MIHVDSSEITDGEETDSQQTINYDRNFSCQSTEVTSPVKYSFDIENDGNDMCT